MQPVAELVVIGQGIDPDLAVRGRGADVRALGHLQLVDVQRLGHELCRLLRRLDLRRLPGRRHERVEGDAEAKVFCGFDCVRRVVRAHEGRKATPGAVHGRGDEHGFARQLAKDRQPLGDQGDNLLAVHVLPILGEVVQGQPLALLGGRLPLLGGRQHGGPRLHHGESLGRRGLGRRGLNHPGRRPHERPRRGPHRLLRELDQLWHLRRAHRLRRPDRRPDPLRPDDHRHHLLRLLRLRPRRHWLLQARLGWSRRGREERPCVAARSGRGRARELLGRGLEPVLQWPLGKIRVRVASAGSG
mmetsp:Transcript_127379/g.396496  ORF Transcript_127379/g.396496 Transcript_127379/m.396496 type:complete len:301 (-) Transcript_127379:17-919(-)